MWFTPCPTIHSTKSPETHKVEVCGRFKIRLNAHRDAVDWARLEMDPEKRTYFLNMYSRFLSQKKQGSSND